MATPRTYEERAYRGRHDRDTGWRATGWGPVLSGAATAFLTFITFSALWLAIIATGSEWVAENLPWFELFTALMAASVGGFVAGWLQPGDAIGGALRGMASWGLLLVVGLIVGIPTTVAVVGGASSLALQQISQPGGSQLFQALQQVGSDLWAAFFIFGGGGVLAAMLGAAGARGDRMTGTDDARYETAREERVIHVDEDRPAERPLAHTTTGEHRTERR